MKVQILPLAPSVCAEFLWSFHQFCLSCVVRQELCVVQTPEFIDAGIGVRPEAKLSFLLEIPHHAEETRVGESIMLQLLNSVLDSLQV